MSTKYPQGIITPTPPYKSTTAKSFSGVWTLEQLANNFYYYKQAISKSLRLRASASAYLNRTPASAGNRQTWTWSGWVKRGILSSSSTFGIIEGNAGVNDLTAFRFSNDTLNLQDYSLGGGYNLLWATSSVFRDPSAWYHIVIVYDTTQASSSNAIKIYVNGVQQSLTFTAAAGSYVQNRNSYINSTNAQRIGVYNGLANYFDGYLAEVNFIDGQALDPSYFGQISPITGVWSPAPYVGSYGTNGFYLKFTDTTSTTTLCYDYSGNSNNWTPNNISLTAGSTYDSMLDSPTNYDNGGNGVGNYAVLNAASIGTDCTLSDGNLGVSYGSAGTRNATMGTIGMSSGKWYFEFAYTGGSTPTPTVGISAKASSTDMPNYPGFNAYGWGYVNDGTKYNNGTGVAYGATWTANDVIGIAFDADSGSLTFYKNGSSQGVAYSGLASGTYYPAIGDGGGAATFTGWFNFGQRPFAYTPPTGYKALNTQNLPAPSIQNGSNFMAATLYTGTGATQSIANAVNGVSFQPDLVWIKSRNAVGDCESYDSVRGATKYLLTDATNAEGTIAQALTAFNSNGFSLGTGSGGNDNTSGTTYVGWQWKAGGTAVTNTAGSITSSVSANTTAGFSVVTYTGTLSSAGTATVGHGLGVAPSMIITKSRSATSDWIVHHVSLATPSYIAYLNLQSVPSDTSPGGTVVAPTSTVFTTNYTTGYNISGVTTVAYCFAAIAGFSAFGSYTGNGSTDGPFIFLGFRPRWVMIKRTDGADNWYIEDTSRDLYNPETSYLDANQSQQEYTGITIDYLSNGFKIRFNGTGINGTGTTHIYAAFAENPFNYSLAR